MLVLKREEKRSKGLKINKNDPKILIKLLIIN